MWPKSLEIVFASQHIAMAFLSVRPPLTSPPALRPRRCCIRAAAHHGRPITRRALGGAVAGVVAGIVSGATPTPTFGVGGLTTESATKTLESARDTLSTVGDAADVGEYESARLTLRRGSLGLLRQAGTTLAVDERRRAAYKEVLAAVEMLDVRLLRAERGGESTAKADVARAQESLDTFLNVVRGT